MTTLAKIDISENKLRKKGTILNMLLHDRSTKRNIIWATDSYINRGSGFAPLKHITSELVTGLYSKVIQPRAAKSLKEQQFRTKEKAEVFTPLRIIDQMNKSVDWKTGNFPAGQETWQNYVKELRLETACGEGPFIVSRYNPTAHTGKIIEIKNRVGFLDRKLRVVSSYCNKPKDWLHWAKEAYKASYGYEWQGDNVLLARENLLYTLLDYYHDKFGRNPSLAIQEEFAEIISWNIFQMDGIKYVIPMSCRASVSKGEPIDKNQLALFAAEKPKKQLVECEGCRTGDHTKHTGRYAKTMDWSVKKPVSFVSLMP